MKRYHIFTYMGAGSTGLILGINGVHYYDPGFWWFLLPVFLYQVAVGLASQDNA